jgi:tetratricopeptide (TPR) repeat protein
MPVRHGHDENATRLDAVDDAKRGRDEPARERPRRAAALRGCYAVQATKRTRDVPGTDAHTQNPGAPARLGAREEAGQRARATKDELGRTAPWAFTRRIRRGAFGWKSQPAIARVRQAVSEIKKVARRDPVLGAEGAVLFLERVKAREAWLERLWDAHANDEIPYIERLGDFWGDLCVSPETASAWADRLVSVIETAWSPDPERRGFFHGTMACFSALLRAGRHEEILALLAKDPFPWWPYRQWGVRALAALGRPDEAIAYAEASRGINDSPVAIAITCEAILLASGRVEEAYRRYALAARQGTSYLTTYRALVRKYPQKRPEELLGDLVATTPGDEGKWFATAKELGLFGEAIRLANQAPCDPKTLTRAARDFADVRPEFAVEAGLAALHWLAEGYGYEITGADVWAAYTNTMKAAEQAGRAGEVRDRIRALVARETYGERFVTRILGQTLGL